MKKTILLVFITLFLTACGAQGNEPGPGMGINNDGMMTRHHAEVPAEYAGSKNPIPADEESLERGAALYTTNCASCHGDGGMGDGPAGSALNPVPAAVAHTSQMMADDYLFWRLSEGGASFGTSMPAWKVFDEQARWDMVNYMRALGSGTVNPAVGMGGEMYDPAVQAAQQAEMLAEAVKQGILTQDEADLFQFVHDLVEQYRSEHPEIMNNGGNATEREKAILAALVDENIITQAQADAFTDIHDRLGTSGLMP
jgi:mono/diheme cytochrome c family protein/polyhydroxyalkanoate synthesis regulator phasin